MHERKLIRNNSLLEKLVIVDGVGRSGKVLIGVTLASMKRVEQVRIDHMLDYIPRLYEMNKLKYDAAVTTLKLVADWKLYDAMISRAVNFRPTDYSGVFKDPNPSRYIERLFFEEGAPVTERVKKEKPIFQNMTHDGLSYASLFFDAFGDKLYFVHMLRDPVGIVYDWHRRDFGTRIGKDPRERQYTFEWRGEAVPIMAYGWEDEYLAIKPMERIIRMIDTMYRKNINAYNELTEKQKERVFFVAFEKFVVNPMPYCAKIAEFLGTEITPITEKVLERERCPRTLNPEDRVRIRQTIEQQSSEKYLTILNKLTEECETFAKVMHEKYNLVTMG